jgi:two-component system, OmpR family, phosphate regulon sensor histidine kinase PhoR
MSRRLKVRRVLRSRFLWRIYAAFLVVLILATASMSVAFLWRMAGKDSLDYDGLVKSLVVSNFAGVFVALGAGLWLSRSVRASLEDITQAAQAMACGDFSARVRRVRRDEFGILGTTLNMLGEELADRMAALSRERAQLQAMLSGLVEGIVAVGDDNQVLFSNRAAEHLLHVDVTEAISRDLSQIAGLGVLLPIVIEARRSGEAISTELNILKGKELMTLAVKATRFKGDVDGGVVIVIHDETELRRLERVRKDFVANVSHELKTPLTSVKGFVETLQSGAKDDPETLNRFLMKIENNVTRLVHLVQDILSLAAADNQDKKAQRERVDWVLVIKQVVQFQDQAIKKKDLHLDLNLPDTCPFFADQESLTQIFDNLLTNAIKYTPNGGKITVNLKAGAEVQLEVKDTGIGIPHEHLPRIFERFYRVDKARSRAMGGTGLGLSIVKHLVGSLSGRVLVASESGQGTTFTVVFQG